MNAVLNDAHVMAWLERLEAQLWTLDGFDSHVTDWLAQLPKSHERNQDERDMGDWFVALCEKDDDKAEIERLTLALKKDDTQAQAVPVEAGAVVEVPASEPLPLTTGDVAHAFDGFHGWSEKQWKKPLGDKPKWLKACIAIPGRQGGPETRWNPVFIAAALVRDGHATARNMRGRFQKKGQLIPWLDAWKTYEADNLDTI